jgi:periplasmic protein CpxP/Spy
MDIFTQKKLLIRIVILLTILNLILIAAVVWNDYFRKPPLQMNQNSLRDVSEILKRDLKLSDKQVEQIRDLRSAYFEKERAISEAIKSERDSMNSSMFSKNANVDLINSLARRVAENEYKMELLRFEQAEELKAICTPEQLQKFEGLILEIRDYFRNDNKPDKMKNNNSPAKPRPARKNRKP